MSENSVKNEEKKSLSTELFGGTTGGFLCVLSAIIAVICLFFAGFQSYGVIREEGAKDKITLDENGEYNDKDEVAAYIYKYGHLPDNYIKKNEAQDAGWIGGSLKEIVPGKDIGGDRHYIEYSYRGDLARADGRYYTECDVNTDGKEDRGTERILFSNDGLVYYTGDHYISYDLLYGREVLDEFYR